MAVLNSKYLFWILLALPAWPLLPEVFVRERYYPEVMHESGVLSVQFMVLALAITPLMKLTGGWRPIRWLLVRRRAIGVAAFGYAALHAGIYIREIGSLELVFLELADWFILVGWIATLLLLALAVTSNNRSQRILGARWKTLQRASYIALALSLYHWWLVGHFMMLLAWWALPIAALQLLRLLWRSKSSSKLEAAKQQ
ncbi:MAG: ferric reductase-like transmembrane domain-containing protein [Pseudomonadota bacterium]